MKSTVEESVVIYSFDQPCYHLCGTYTRLPDGTLVTRYPTFLSEEEYLAQTNPPSSSPIVGSTPSRNSPCPCGSGKKYKRCCINNGH